MLQVQEVESQKLFMDYTAQGQNPISVSLCRVSPHTAEGWMNSAKYPQQRKIRKNNLDYLTRQIELGRFIEGSQIHFCRIDGQLYLVNGQHTLSAIVSSRIPTLLTILITNVNSIEEVNLTYARHDQHRRRMFGDSLRATDMPAELSITITQAEKLASAGVRIYNLLPGGGTDSRVFSFEEKQEIVSLWAEEGKLFFKSIAGAPPEIAKALQRASTLSIALLTLRNCPEKALLFWKQVALNDGLRIGDPRKTLHEWLRLARETGGGISHGVTAKFTMQTVAVAWNAFYANRKLSRFKKDVGDAPFFIAGTPYTADKKAF